MKAGITGHRDLGDPSTIAWIEKEILTEFNKLIIEKVFSSLAVGADQLFAAVCLKKNLPLIAVIPCHNYEKTFPADQIDAYHSILMQASEIIQLEYEDPTDTAFYEAGKLMVNKSDIIFAVWNNKPAKGPGGTADIVAYAKSQNKKLIHFNPVTKTVRYIMD